MELVTVARRDGEALVTAYGCEFDDESDSLLYVGMLYVRGGLTRPSLLFRDPQTKMRYRLRLPERYLRLPSDAYVRNATLEVT